MNEGEAAGQLSPNEKIDKAIADINLLVDAYKTILRIPGASGRESFPELEDLVPASSQNAFWKKWPPEGKLGNSVIPSKYAYDIKEHERLLKQFMDAVDYIKKCNAQEEGHSLSDPRLPAQVAELFDNIFLLSAHVIDDGGYHSLPAHDRQSEAVNFDIDREKDLISIVMGAVAASAREIREVVVEPAKGRSGGGERGMGM